MRVAQDACRLDAAVEELGRLGQLPALAPDRADGLDQDEHVFALAGRSRECKRAVGVTVALGVAVEIQLDASEQCRGLEVAGELVVRQRVDQQLRLGPGGFCTRGGAVHRVGQGEAGEGGCSQTSVFEASCRRHGALGSFLHHLVPRPPGRVHRQVDQQRHCFRRVLIGQVRQRIRKAESGLVVLSEESFDARALAVEPGAQLRGILRHQRDSLEQGVVAIGKATSRG